MQKVIIANDLREEITRAVAECRHDGVFILTDTTTQRLCLPLVRQCPCLASAKVITIPEGDANKTLAAAGTVWEALQKGGATRHSLLINIGGGMVTDLGGFAAATFKRGINFINVPTTLLAMVDAAIGGKTGVNFGGLKNEIGAFCEAAFVIISDLFLHTLDRRNIASGYAEMLKHALITTPENEQDKQLLERTLAYDMDEMASANHHDGTAMSLIATSIKIKERIVRQDPTEGGVRKALNFGHTIGHAIEEWSLTTDRAGAACYLHGYAVAFGMVAELYLSARKCGFSHNALHQAVNFIKENYGAAAITCDDYPTLLQLMHHDKKNTGNGSINFTLLADVGDIRINQSATDEEIKEALDFLREG